MQAELATVILLISVAVLLVWRQRVQGGPQPEIRLGGKDVVKKEREHWGVNLREDVIRAARLRELVIRTADDPSDANLAAICSAVPSSRLFLLVGGAPVVEPGTTVTAGTGDNWTLPMVHVREEAGEMVFASAAPPQEARALDGDVSHDAVIASMNGRKLLEMVMKMPADGLVISAGDERKSWVALTREQISAILAKDRWPSSEQ